jgi:dolichol-phosphate mannosyltransferase
LSREPTWPSLAIVVPVYNEGASLAGSIRELTAVAESYPGRAAVVAVDDGSSDGSAGALRGLESELETLEVDAHESNRGYGAALRTGALRARSLGLDYLAFIDSNLTNPPADLLKIGELARSGHPYVKGSRFIPGGGMSSVPFSRRLVSRLGNVVARLLFGTRAKDLTNGFRGVRTEVFLSWPLKETGFPVILEELDWALRSGIEPVEFPTVLTSRSEGQRATAFTYSPRILFSYLKYALGAFSRRLRRRGSGPACARSAAVAASRPCVPSSTWASCRWPGASSETRRT